METKNIQNYFKRFYNHDFKKSRASRFFSGVAAEKSTETERPNSNIL
jgi:hypothetical protein